MKLTHTWDEWYPVLLLCKPGDTVDEKQVEFSDEEMARIRAADEEWGACQMMIYEKFYKDEPDKLRLFTPGSMGMWDVD